MAAKAKARGASRADLATLAGLLLALGGILGGMVLEGGELREIFQPTAALIVLGGTAGAVLVTSPMSAVRRSFRAFLEVFIEKDPHPESVIDQLVAYATKARKNGIVSLEEEASLILDPFLRKALTLAVDGTDLQELRKMMELEIELEEHHVEAEAKVFESAGGYAPTIGIIGAVIGLIQTMKHLANIEEVGHGIATAFVATIYGVGSANILFLPAGGKIRARAQSRMQLKEMMLEGVLSIVEGMNPKLIRGKLEAYALGAPSRSPDLAAAPGGKK